MESERRIKAETRMKELLGRKNIIQMIMEVKELLYSNNDCLENPTNDYYLRYLSTIRQYAKYASDYDAKVYLQYRNIIRKIRRFIDSITAPDDMVSKYAFLLKMINSSCLSGQPLTRNRDNYLDAYKYLGADVILGNCCCRHQASLIKDVIDINALNTVRVGIGNADNTTINHRALVAYDGQTNKYLFNNPNTVRVGVGDGENIPANHCVLAAYDRQINKYLFLDSISALAYNPNGNEELIKSNGKKRYIKANCSYSHFEDFTNMDDFIDFFKKVYKSNLTKEEFEDVMDRVFVGYRLFGEMYKDDFIDFSRSIRDDREKLKSLVLK